MKVCPRTLLEKHLLKLLMPRNFYPQSILTILHFLNYNLIYTIFRLETNNKFYHLENLS